MTNQDKIPRRWYNPAWWDGTVLPTEPIIYKKLRESLENAVVRQLMSDVPYGVLLSGGLDSSLVASITARSNSPPPILRPTPLHSDLSELNKNETLEAVLVIKPKFSPCRHASRMMKDGKETGAPFPRLHTFSVGLPESPDLVKARQVADYLGTVHHEFTFTIAEGLDAIKDLVYILETYDVTTIRAATPMYLMSRKIRAFGFKMVLSGEGADELFGGYMYFHKAPNAREFHEETVRKMKDLYMFDCLRANKSTMAWGLEARVPFLDNEFIEVSMSINPEEKMCVKNGEKRMEKWILRKAFDTRDDPYLPDDVLWRQKEQFSDGVGYSWIDSIKEYAESHVSDAMMSAASHKYPHNTPFSKEAYYFRSLFEEHYPQNSSALTVPGGPSVACSTAKAIEWDESFKNMNDPSGRAVDVHTSAYKAKAAKSKL